ncbi:MAG: 30S ribosomal protein S20 [Ignavibacteriales bacterium]|nr:30S ribosomal protein S20 [Ignavibacteriales bacterium]MCF8305586.1 30S ribosomal protein S20 [Ignavibacteriales bacterium]MCF8315308.1 30S ribosomal protein S20 [Ignavibacteriales bacterium]MCF8436800.1 30S ribosomal protein S20 [Ignavibacteriales bacterium]
MAHHKSAKKRIKISAQRNERNKAAFSKIKTLTKKVLSAKVKNEAEVDLKEAVSYIDKNVNKGRLHKNNAARKKSALVRYVNNLA